MQYFNSGFARNDLRRSKDLQPTIWAVQCAVAKLYEIAPTELSSNPDPALWIARNLALYVAGEFVKTGGGELSRYFGSSDVWFFISLYKKRDIFLLLACEYLVTETKRLLDTTRTQRLLGSGPTEDWRSQYLRQQIDLFPNTIRDRFTKHANDTLDQPNKDARDPLAPSRSATHVLYSKKSSVVRHTDKRLSN